VVKTLPTIAADDPVIEWDPTGTIEADDPGIELASHAHADPHDEQEPNDALPDPAPNENATNEMRCVLTLPGDPKEHMIPQSNAAMHAFANHKVPGHSLINSAALVDYGVNGGIVGCMISAS